MQTSAAGADFDLQYGDIFETDDATAKRLLSDGIARQVTKADANAPVKVDPATTSRGTQDPNSGSTSSEESNEVEQDEAEEADAPAEPDPLPTVSRRQRRR